jgi:hypothetical protein
MASEARYSVITCGYSYPGAPPNGWSGGFYPKVGGKCVDELEFYAAPPEALLEAYPNLAKFKDLT